MDLVVSSLPSGINACDVEPARCTHSPLLLLSPLFPCLGVQAVAKHQKYIASVLGVPAHKVCRETMVHILRHLCFQVPAPLFPLTRQLPPHLALHRFRHSDLPCPPLILTPHTPCHPRPPQGGLQDQASGRWFRRQGDARHLPAHGHRGAQLPPEAAGAHHAGPR